MEPKLMTIPVDGKPLTIARREEGEGPVILFLHGWLQSGKIWDKVISILSGEYRLIAIDLPGFGESPALEPPQISVRAYARIVGAVIAALSEEHPLGGLVADSLSGVLVAHACGQSPTLPKTRLLISGCPFDGLTLVMRIVPVSLFLEPGLRNIRRMPASFRDRLIRWLSKFTVYDVKNFSPEIVRGAISADPETAKVLFNELKAPVPHTLADALRRHQCTLLRGKFDRLAAGAMTRQWADRTAANYVELDRSAHTPMIEEPEAYAQAIRVIMY
jgi:pimeloyl-ACP methyl ester carboxylesterase